MLKNGVKKIGVFLLVVGIFLIGCSGKWVREVRAAFDERTETNAQGASLNSPYQVTLSVPTGTANGDLMFTWIGSYSTTVTTNAAWTLLGSYTAGTDKYYLFARVASNEPSSYVWTFSGTTKYKATSTTYIASADFDVSNVSTDLTVSNTSYRTSDATNRAAAFSVPNANSPILFFGGVYSTTVRTQTPPTVPGTFIEDYDAGHSTPDFSLEIASYIWAGSGNSGNIDSTISANSATKHAFAVALKPPAIVVPTVTTQAASSVLTDTAVANGTLTAAGGENADKEGFVYSTSSQGLPGNVAPTSSGYASYTENSGSFTTGAFTVNLSGLTGGVTYYGRAYAHNSAGYSYGDEISFTTTIISIIITSDGTVSYGTVAGGTTKSTIDLSDTQTVKNNGTAAEDFTITGQNSANWTLAASAGSEQYVHKFSINGGGAWTALTLSPVSLVANIAVNGTQNFDLQIAPPTSTNFFTEQSVNVTITATQH